MTTVTNTKTAQTGRILQAINAPVNKVTSIISMFEKNHNKVMSALADWLDLALEMPPTQDGVPFITAVLNFQLANEAQQAWNAHYGNRTKEEVEKGIVTEADNRAMWCSEQRLAYAETVWFGHAETSPQYVINIQNRTIGLAKDEEGMQGPSLEKQQAQTAYVLALLNFQRTKAKLDAAMEEYEFICGEPYVYTKFERKSPRMLTANSLASKKAAEILKLRKGL